MRVYESRCVGWVICSRLCTTRQESCCFCPLASCMQVCRQCSLCMHEGRLQQDGASATSDDSTVPCCGRRGSRPQQPANHKHGCASCVIPQPLRTWRLSRLSHCATVACVHAAASSPLHARSLAGWTLPEYYTIAAFRALHSRKDVAATGLTGSFADVRRNMLYL